MITSVIHRERSEAAACSTTLAVFHPHSSCYHAHTFFCKRCIASATPLSGEPDEVSALLKQVVGVDVAENASRISRREMHDISEKPPTFRMMGEDPRGQVQARLRHADGVVDSHPAGVGECAEPKEHSSRRCGGLPTVRPCPLPSLPAAAPGEALTPYRSGAIRSSLPPGAHPTVPELLRAGAFSAHPLTGAPGGP